MVRPGAQKRRPNQGLWTMREVKEKPPVRSESVIQRECLNHLLNQGYFFWRNNVAKARLENGTWIDTGTPGLADLAGMTKSGRAVFIEIKNATNKQQKSQIEFEEKVKANGGLYFLIRSHAEIKQLVKSGVLND